MAQTITTVRGNVSAGNSSQTTLFTQSGGNSTRVILNQVAWYYSSRIFPIYGNLLHVSSSGPVTVIGYNAPTYSGQSAQLMPNPNATGPLETIGVGTSYGYANGMHAYASTAGWPGSINWVYNTNGASYMPQNCWIGPGDSIAFLQYNEYAYSATVGYHFTTITES